MPLIEARINDVVKALFLIYAIGLIVNVGSVAVDNALTGTLHGVAGEIISMACDLRDINDNFIWFRNPFNFLNIGEYLEPDLPPDIKNRIRVQCLPELEACNLTINDLRTSDAGSYSCGYQKGGNRISSSSATLIISVPPTESSPRCILGNHIDTVISPDIANVGDAVRFGCSTIDGDPDPFVYIARDGSEISTPVTRSLTVHYVFSQIDEGSTFTCVMTHPALAQPRNCTFLTLRRSRTTTVLESLGTIATEIKTAYSTEKSGSGEVSLNTLSKTSIIVIAVLGTIIICLISMMVVIKVIWRRRSHQFAPVAAKADQCNPVVDDTYTEISKHKNNHHEYTMLKTQAAPDNADDGAYATPDNDEYAYASPQSSDYEVKIKPDEVKKLDNNQEAPQDESHQPADTYTELSTQRDDHHEYTMLKTQPALDNADDGAYATPDNDEYAYASPQSSDYEVNVISNEVKRADSNPGAPQDTSSAPSYANATVILKGKIPKK